MVLRAQRLLSDEQPSSASSCNLLVDTLFLPIQSAHAPPHGIFSGRSVSNSEQTVHLTAAYSIITAPLDMSFVSRPLVFWGIAGCFSCAGSTAAPIVLVTRTGYRVSLVELAG